MTTEGAPIDGSAQSAGDCTQHELRGGSWFTQPDFVRTAYRNRFDGNYRSTSVGFRLIREMPAMRRLARIVPSAAALLLLTLLASSRVAVAASESTCVNGGQQNPDIAARKTALQRSPTQLGKRMELANLLEKAGCYDEAVHLLEEGQKYNPYNPTLLFSLRRARNMVKEEHISRASNKPKPARD